MKRVVAMALAALTLPACGGADGQREALASDSPVEAARPLSAPRPTQLPDPETPKGAERCDAEPKLSPPSPDPTWEQHELAGGRTVSFPKTWASDGGYLELRPSLDAELRVEIGYSVRTGEPTHRERPETDWPFWAKSVIPVWLPRTEEALPNGGCLLTGTDGVDAFAVSIWPVSDAQAQWVRAAIPNDATEEDLRTALAIVLSPASDDVA